MPFLFHSHLLFKQALLCNLVNNLQCSNNDKIPQIGLPGFLREFSKAMLLARGSQVLEKTGAFWTGHASQTLPVKNKYRLGHNWWTLNLNRKWRLAPDTASTVQAGHCVEWINQILRIPQE